MALFDEKAKLLAQRAASAMAAAAEAAPQSKKSKKREKSEKRKERKTASNAVPDPVSKPTHASAKPTANSTSKSVPAPKKPVVSSPAASSAKAAPAKSTSKSSKSNALLAEIRLLGGDEQDLELLQDVLSGSEMGDSDHEDSKKALSAGSSKKSAVIKSDDEVAKALKDFLANDLKLDPRKSKVEVVSQNDEDREQEIAAAIESEDEEDQDEAKTAEPITLEPAVTQPKQAKGVPQPKSDPAVAKRINEMLSSNVFNAAASELVFEPTPLWYAVELAPVKEATVYSATDEALILKMYEKAKALYAEEVQRYDKVKFQSSSDRNFMKTVLKSGTTTDKISALTLLIQESPLHTLYYLRDQIIHGMARKKSRRDALVAVDAVKDLLTGSVLPDRKLKYFRDQGVLSPGVQPIHLIVWFFEDSLKRVYFEFLQLIEELSKDPLTHIKSKTLTYLCMLLSAKPEQEAALLSLLVNKLGDANSTLAFKAAHLMQSGLLQQHPNMKLVVVKEVERLLARSSGGGMGQSARARYAALSFCSQIVLRRGVDTEVAKRLVGVYFSIFEVIVEQLERPFEDDRGRGGKSAKGKKGKGKKSRYVRGHGSKKKGKPLSAEEAMKLGGEVAGDSEDEAEAEAAVVDGADGGKSPKLREQVVEGIDAKTMAVLLTGVNRSFPYAEMDDEVFDKHMNTLFKISHLGSFNISIQALTLIFQVHSSRQTISDRFYRSLYETLIDSRLPGCSKHPMYLNLLHRAMKADTSLTRSRAFIKRIVQTCTMSSTPFICGALFLVGDILKMKPGLWSLVTMGEDGGDGIEQFVDVDEEGKENVKKHSSEETKKYDGKKRDPLYCNAELSCLWELTCFAEHFHPTVSLYAQTLLSGSPIAIPETATAYDPLQNHTLARFLDRFVFKNPKKVTSAYRGSSLMQPRPPGMMGGGVDAETGATLGNLIAGARKRGVIVEEEGEDRVAMDDAPVNSGAWLNRGRDKIPVDELFFYDFFTDKKSRAAGSKKKNRAGGNEDLDDATTLGGEDDEDAGDSDDGAQRGGDTDEAADDANELDEEEIWDAMLRSVKSAAPDDGLGDEEEFDMEEAMKEAEAAFSKKKQAGSDDEDDDDDDDEDEEVMFGDDDFAAFEEGLGGVDGEGDDDDYEDVEDDDEEVVMLQPKGKKGKRGAVDDDEDEDGLIGEDADEELASMFMGEEDSDAESDEEGNAKAKKDSKVGKGKSGKLQLWADQAKQLGYKGDYFTRKLGKSKAANDDDDSGGLGAGFASLDDFMDLVERDDDDEDTGGFGSGISGAGTKKGAVQRGGAKRKNDGKRSAPPNKRTKK
ncbi:CBF/Mak21 family-domain-containing protein, partial [Chytriomyces cf. hyalinus JEL632]